MQIKRLMRFYFSAGSLDRAFNNLITQLALAAGRDTYAGCEVYFLRIAEVIAAKEKLGRLWARLDGILSAMTEADRTALRQYASMRRRARPEEKRELHRAAVKFTRRAGGLLCGGGDLYRVLCAYMCLVSSEPD